MVKIAHRGERRVKVKLEAGRSFCRVAHTPHRRQGKARLETAGKRPGEESCSPGSAPWRQLLIAQDTGGGILGAVRGDIYWGDTAAAADRGGRMGGAGKYWLLLPKGVTK